MITRRFVAITNRVIYRSLLVVAVTNFCLPAFGVFLKSNRMKWFRVHLVRCAGRCWLKQINGNPFWLYILATQPKRSKNPSSHANINQSYRDEPPRTQRTHTAVCSCTLAHTLWLAGVSISRFFPALHSLKVCK